MREAVRKLWPELEWIVEAQRREATEATIVHHADFMSHLPFKNR